jgi:small-conductance mechanosensitive channel
VENFVSGLILLFERPVKVGDLVQMQNQQGNLKHIGLRASVLRTTEGAEIIVPNGQLISQEVTNWTLSDPLRRIDINVGVKYGVSPKKVIRLLEKIGKDHPEADKSTPARAIFLDFGESSINFQLRVWTANQFNWTYIKSELTIEIYESFNKAGIEIPFPQRDLNIRAVDPEVLATFSQNGN